jgi:apolipoprotein N-acyltransferase
VSDPSLSAQSKRDKPNRWDYAAIVVLIGGAFGMVFGWRAFFLHVFDHLPEWTQWLLVVPVVAGLLLTFLIVACLYGLTLDLGDERRKR